MFFSLKLFSIINTHEFEWASDLANADLIITYRELICYVSTYMQICNAHAIITSSYIFHQKKKKNKIIIYFDHLVENMINKKPLEATFSFPYNHLHFIYIRCLLSTLHILRTPALSHYIKIFLFLSLILLSSSFVLATLFML